MKYLVSLFLYSLICLPSITAQSTGLEEAYSKAYNYHYTNKNTIYSTYTKNSQTTVLRVFIFYIRIKYITIPIL